MPTIMDWNPSSALVLTKFYREGDGELMWEVG